VYTSQSTWNQEGKRKECLFHRLVRFTVKMEFHRVHRPQKEEEESVHFIEFEEKEAIPWGKFDDCLNFTE